MVYIQVGYEITHKGDPAHRIPDDGSADSATHQ